MTRQPEKSTRGKPVNLYFPPDDLEGIRKLRNWLADQLQKNGYLSRVSDSQVLRACFRLAKRDDALVKALLAVAGTDGRLRAKTKKGA